MNIKTILVWPLAFLMMLVSLAFPPQAQADGDIAEIYICWDSASARITDEYKIDLERGNFWFYHYFSGNPLRGPRNENGLFEGYWFAHRLSNNQIKAFLTVVEESGFAEWEGEYNISDELPPPGGSSWNITITFVDGSVRTSYGTDWVDYGHPEGWAEMRTAFWLLTGMRLL